MDDLVRNFDYKEKPQVFEYYPQYYHKTDKVCSYDLEVSLRSFVLTWHRKDDQFISSSLAGST